MYVCVSVCVMFIYFNTFIATVFLYYQLTLVGHYVEALIKLIVIFVYLCHSAVKNK